MSKPSLSDFAAQPAPAPKPEKPQGEAVKNLTYRLTKSRWLALKSLAMTEETTTQALIDRALVAEFERRGLRF